MEGTIKADDVSQPRGKKRTLLAIPMVRVGVDLFFA